MKNPYILIIAFIFIISQAVSAQESGAVENEEDKLFSDVTEKKKDRFVNNQEEDRKVDMIELPVKPVAIKYEKKLMSRGENMAVIVKIPEADIKSVQKGWEKAIKNKTKSKVQKELNETWIASTLLTEIFKDPIAVYGKVIATEEGIDVMAFFEVDSTFISDENDEEKVASVSRFMRRFGVAQYKNAVSEQLKSEEKKLKEYKHRLSKLQKENEKLHKNIKANESNIINRESDIEVNKSDQVINGKEAEKYKLEISTARDPEQEKEAKKALKGKEKEKKRLQKKNQEMHKDIARFRAEIEKAKRDIQYNLDQQAMEDDAIKKQIVMVRAVENKLTKIK